MIHLKTKVHDHQTLEFKIGYETEPGLQISTFQVGLWMFIPGSLEANEHTYTADSFYEDLKTRLRLITPRYSLKQLSDEEAKPYQRLREVIQEAEDTKAFHHEICMVCNILKSGLRDAIEEVLAENDPAKRHELLQTFLLNLRSAIHIYRDLAHDVISLPLVSRLHYQHGDEFLCESIRHYLYGRAEIFNNEINPFLLELQEYMQTRGYALPQPERPEQSRDFLHRYGMLKKEIESELYIRTHKKNSGFLLEQLMFMLSAGMAMGFALLVNFYTKDAANKYSLPLILLMIVSYMFKDRIKDWLRSWFHNRSGEVFFDRRQRLEMNDTDIGSSRQSFEYLSPNEVKQTILQAKQQGMKVERADFMERQEVIHYCRAICLKRNLIRRLSHLPLNGVDEICRLNLTRLMRWMDNPQVSAYLSAKDGSILHFQAPRTYDVYLVLENTFNGKSQYFSYRIELNSDGIIALEQLS